MRADKSNTRFESCRLQRAATGLICLNERAMDCDGGTATNGMNEEGEGRGRGAGGGGRGAWGRGHRGN